MEPVVLEDWLRAASTSVLSKPSASLPTSGSAPEFSANAIVQAWAQIRACVQRKSLSPQDSAAFHLLNQHRRSLHLAESQAKLLIAVLTDLSSSDMELLGFVRRFAILGLLAWIRKGFTGSGTNISSTQQHSETIVSVVQIVCKALKERPLSDSYTCESILLLGTISSSESVSRPVRNDCVNTISVELNKRKTVITRGELAEALAGAGYAMAASVEHIIPILWTLLFLWESIPIAEAADSAATGVAGEQKVVLKVNAGDRSGVGWPILKDVIMLLHLVDYVGSRFLSRRGSQSSTPEVELMHDALLRAVENDNSANYTVQCTTIMASVGLFRSLYRWDEDNKKRGISTPIDCKDHAILGNLGNVIVEIIGRAVVAPELSISNFRASTSHGEPSKAAEARQLGRCASIALSRGVGLPAHPCILHCLVLCIFNDAVYLDGIYSKLSTADLQRPSENSQPYITQNQEKFPGGKDSLSDIQIHVESLFFRETGALVRAMCGQYLRSSRDVQVETEHLISNYARNLYEKHRLLVATSQKPLKDRWPQYIQPLEKILETSFLTLVVFFSTAVRENVSDDSNSSEAELAALALDSLSCVEYFRHVQLREFSRVVQRCVLQILKLEASSVALARFLPSYQEVIQSPGTPDLNQSYSWAQDEVQTTRILFYFRILPMCLLNMPEAAFATEVAPLMFLYMQHPSEMVTKASHGLFAAFLSLGTKPDLTLKVVATNSQQSTSCGPKTAVMSLREQFVVFYMQRALEVFPGVTPFQGLVAGVGAIARHLPSGSPATVYCLNCLVDKAITLYTTDSKLKNADKAEKPEKDLAAESNNQQTGAAEKLQMLLLHLILLVDLQVLPILLRLVAKLILGLPQQLRATALAEAFDVVGGTDDYTRKPIIVPWLQSLSFLVHNVRDKPHTTEPRVDHSGTRKRSENGPSSLIDYNPNSSENLRDTSDDGYTSAERSLGHSIQETAEDEVTSIKSGIDSKQVLPISEVSFPDDAPEGNVEDNRQAVLGDGALELTSKL